MPLNDLFARAAAVIEWTSIEELLKNLFGM
jgi:hypothetical protein